jgi:hypothetical protein
MKAMKDEDPLRLRMILRLHNDGKNLYIVYANNIGACLPVVQG